MTIKVIQYAFWNRLKTTFSFSAPNAPFSQSLSHIIKAMDIVLKSSINVNKKQMK